MAKLISKLRDMDAGCILSRVAFLILGFLLFVTTNSHYTDEGNLDAVTRISVLCLFVLVVAFLWVDWLISTAALRRFSAWVIVVAVAYAITVIHSGGSLGGVRTALYFAMVVVFPLGIYLMRERGLFPVFCRCYTFVAASFGLLSVLVWLVGPILHLVLGTSMVEYTWNSAGTVSLAQGYYGLVYETQTISFGPISLWRNTGIFLESPMYSFALCIALGFEVFLQRHPSRVLCLILSVTIVTTVSTTGIVFIAYCVLCAVVRRVTSGGLSRRAKLVIAVLLAATVVIAVLFTADKLLSSSGGTRVDDYRAGFLAWIQHPLLGGGFDGATAYRQFVSAYRLDNQGFSNSLFDVLMKGGMTLGLVYVVQFVGLFYCDGRKRLFALGFLFLWVITIVSALPLAGFVLSMGVAELMRADRGGRGYKERRHRPVDIEK